MTHSPLTVRYERLNRAVVCEIGVVVPFTEKDPPPKVKKFKAVWDTGATCTVITKKVVSELKLKPIDVQEVSTASTTGLANVYLVNVLLPSNVNVANVRVVELDIKDSDVLIGMDIITLGDFSITNHKDKTCMSFRIPSGHEIDYVKEAQIEALPRKQKREWWRKNRPYY